MAPSRFTAACLLTLLAACAAAEAAGGATSPRAQARPLVAGKAVCRGSPLRVVVRSSGPGRLLVTVQVSGRSGRQLRLARAVTFRRPGQRRLRIGFTRRALGRLGRCASVRLRVTARTLGGRTTTKGQSDRRPPKDGVTERRALGSEPPLPDSQRPARPLLRWAPPALERPIVVQVSNENRALRLDPKRDYVVRMPPAPLTASGGLVIAGGHNVVLIGGEIAIPWQGAIPPANSRRALFLKEQTGTVCVEGLLLRGADIGEGIQLDERKGAIVQLQNIRVEYVHARDQIGFTDTHPDVLQTWGGPDELRIDGLSGSTGYQGFFLHPTQFGTPAPRRFDFRRVDLTGTGTAGNLFWRAGTFPLDAQDVLVRPNPKKTLAQTLWPSIRAWPSVKSTSLADEFVPAGQAGLGYVSPGYQGP